MSTFGAIDYVNSDEQHMYIDMIGIGTIIVKKSDGGIEVLLYPLHVVDEPLLDELFSYEELFRSDLE